MEHYRYVTEAEVRVIVNEIVSSKFDELFGALNRLRGAMWALGLIMGSIKLIEVLFKR